MDETRYDVSMVLEITKTRATCPGHNEVRFFTYSGFQYGNGRGMVIMWDNVQPSIHDIRYDSSYDPAHEMSYIMRTFTDAFDRRTDVMIREINIKKV